MPSMFRYFVPVGCFLVFNVCDLLGRLLAQVTSWPTPTWPGSLITLGFAILRLAFIPLLLFCNIRCRDELKCRLHTWSKCTLFSPDDRHFSEVYFKSDAAFLTINVLFSVIIGIYLELNFIDNILSWVMATSATSAWWPPPRWSLTPGSRVWPPLTSSSSW